MSTRAARPRRAAAAVDGGLTLSVWVRLLKAHGLVLRQVRRRVPEGLTLPQFDVLVQLHRRDDGMTPGELTRALLVTAGNVTGIVSRLVAVDLARRQPVPEDGRTVLIRLTPRGRRLMRRAIPRHRRDVATLFSGVSPADLGRLRDLLGRLNRTLEREP